VNRSTKRIYRYNIVNYSFWSRVFWSVFSQIQSLYPDWSYCLHIWLIYRNLGWTYHEEVKQKLCMPVKSMNVKVSKSPLMVCASMERNFERGHPRSWLLDAGSSTRLFVDQCACARIAGLELLYAAQSCHRSDAFCWSEICWLFEIYSNSCKSSN